MGLFDFIKKTNGRETEEIVHEDKEPKDVETSADCRFSPEHMAEKDKYIQKVKELFAHGNYEEVLNTVEYMDAYLASDYRSKDMEELYDLYHDSDSRLYDAKEGRYAEEQESTEAAANTEDDESLFSSDLPVIDEEMRKKMQDDAYRRLGELADLGMDSTVFVHCLADMYYCCCMKEDGRTEYVEFSELPQEYQLAVKAFEESEPGMVYHMILREGRLYMLYVSACPSTWVDEGVFVNKEYYNDANAKGYSIFSAEVYEPGNDGTRTVDIQFYIKDGAIVVVKEVEYGTWKEHVFEEWPEDIFGGEESEKPDADAASNADCNSSQLIEGEDVYWWFEEGIKYYHGKGVDVNYTKALECMENAARLSSITAMYNCGLMYSQGNGTETDFGKAFGWYKKAADLGNVKAQYELSILYLEGKGCEADVDLSEMWLEKAADNGHVDACMLLASFLEDEEDSDRTKILRLYETAAQQGNSEAMVHCCDMYSEGEGSEEDKEKAAYWADKALEANDAEMLFRIGYSKLNENKENRDRKEVFDQYLIPSADQGHSGALLLCGYAYLVGTFFEQDKKRGIELIETSAEKGYTVSIEMLYDLYTKGELIAADSEKAFYWLEQLAETGDTEAIRQVAKAYENTDNSFADREKTLFWYRKLAQTGDADAMYKVFDMLKNTYSEEDQTDAGFWVLRAADSGHPKALEIITQFYFDNDDYDRVLQYGLKSAENGDIFAMTVCADIYLDGKGSTEKDLKKALYWGEKAAKAGDIASMLLCGFLHADENGEIPVDKEKARYWLGLVESALENSTKQDLYCESVADLCYMCARDNSDLSKAFYWYKKSALNGERESIHKCAMMCLHGEGCEKNYDKAMEFAELAAEQGDDGSMLAEIADIIRDGKEGLSVNKTEALRWYKKAGECGNVYAMTECAEAYYSEDGTSGNNAEALYWYKKAASAGKVYCMTIVGLMYAQGMGTAQDDKQAFYWLNKAAEAGDDIAMLNLGSYYLAGKGGAPRDPHKAIELFEKASKSDVKEVSDMAHFDMLLAEEMIKKQK